MNKGLEYRVKLLLQNILNDVAVLEVIATGNKEVTNITNRINERIGCFGVEEYWRGIEQAIEQMEKEEAKQRSDQNEG